MNETIAMARDLALINLLAAARSMVAACDEDNKPAAGEALADLIQALEPYKGVAR